MCPLRAILIRVIIHVLAQRCQRDLAVELSLQHMWHYMVYANVLLCLAQHLCVYVRVCVCFNVCA